MCPFGFIFDSLCVFALRNASFIFFLVPHGNQVLQTPADFWILSDGVGKEVQYVLLDQFRLTFSYGMSSSERSDPLSYGQKDTYFLLKNCLDGVLVSFMQGYEESKETINRESENMIFQVLAILLLSLIVPPIVYAAISFFVYIFKSRLNRFLSGMGFLTTLEVAQMAQRLSVLHTVFNESLDEITLGKNLRTYAVGLRNSNELAKPIKKTKKVRSVKESGSSKKTLVENENVRKKRRSTESFRFLSIILTFIGITFCLSFSGCIYYWAEIFEISSVSSLSTALGDIRNQKFQDSFVYSVIVAYIGTFGDSLIMGQDIEEKMDDILSSENLTTFVETYLVQASDKMDSQSFFKHLDYAENTNLCETILSDDVYCPFYGDGVFQDGFSAVVEFVSTELKTSFQVTSHRVLREWEFE